MKSCKVDIETKSSFNSRKDLKFYFFAFASALSFLMASHLISPPEAMAKKGKKKIVIEVDEDDDTIPELTSAPSAGFVYKLVTNLSAEQNIFSRYFDKGDFEKALFQWPSAFADTEFGDSASGKALSAYLFYKNGIQVYAMEMLLSIDEPNKISPHVLKLWKSAASDGDVNWTYVNPRLWKSIWTENLDAATEVRVRGHQTFALDQQKELHDLIKKSTAGTVERAWLEWQAMLAQATAGDSAAAAKQLSHLMKATKNPVGRDLMTLTAGRLLYQNGYLDAAIKYYNQVGKSSDDWFDAQEELAWAQLRKGEPQDAIATTKTLVVPEFTALIGPEAVFVRSLAYLKVCDYPEVTKTLGVFRDQFRDRAKSMLEVAEAGNTPAVQAFVSRLKKEGYVRQIDLGGQSAKLPRFISRDENLRHLIAAEYEFEKEAAKFKELYGRSITGGSAKVGFQGRLEQMSRELETRVKSAKAASYFRVKALAQDELNEIAQILQKMHVVEAEVLQQVALSGRVIGSTGDMKAVEKKGSTGSKERDRLVFPDEGETWFDELANYQVDLKKGCQSVKR